MDLIHYEKAKEISDEVLGFAKKIVKKGARIVEIAESIEKKIVSLGGGLAFPVNVCLNDIAAHYSPFKEDESELKEGDLVKVDFGVHVNGYIWDRAFSVVIGRGDETLIDASAKAVERALEVAKAGKRVDDISEVIEKTLKEFNVNPIVNLSGHGIERYKPHSYPTIPSIKTGNKVVLKKGAVIAIEVFTTRGEGTVVETDTVSIYQYLADKPVRSFTARKILRVAKEEFKGLPFARRWIHNIGEKTLVDMSLKELVLRGCLKEYPVLREKSNSVVAQTEETVIIR